MRFDKRTRKIRTKKRKKRKGSGTSTSFWTYLAAGGALLVLFYVMLYVSHERDLRRGRQEKIQEDFDRICAAAILYFQDHRRYPALDAGMSALLEGRGGPEGGPEGRRARPGYLTHIPRDPWGNPYELRTSRDGRKITLICWGADGRPGGNGEDADVFREGCRSTGLPLE